MAIFSEDFTASNQTIDGYNDWETSGTGAGTLAIVSNKAVHTSSTNRAGDRKDMGAVPGLPITATITMVSGKGVGGGDRWEHFFMIGADIATTYNSLPATADRGAYVLMAASGSIRMFDGATQVGSNGGDTGFGVKDIEIFIDTDGSGYVKVDGVSKVTWAARTWANINSTYCIITMDVSASNTTNDGSLAYFDTISVDYAGAATFTPRVMIF